MWGLRYPQFTGGARRRFGPTYTVRPGTMEPIVLTTDPDAIRSLLTDDPLRKHHGNDAVRPLIGERSLLLLEPREHLDRRRLLLPPFHGERVRGYAQLMRRLIDQQVARWRAGETVAVLPAAQTVTIEVILQAVLGVVDTEMRRGFRALIDDVLFYPLGALRLRLGHRLALPMSPPRPLRELAAFGSALMTPAVMTYYPEMKVRSRWNVVTTGWWRSRDRLLAVLDEQIAATRSDPRLADRDDILAMLVQARDEEGRALGTDDLRDDLIALIGAGHETTAAAIAWGAALLAHDREVQQRARVAAREGDSAYIGALVKEVLRIRSPLPVAAGRRLEEPLALGPHRVPAGTPILIDAWGLHHDPERYPDPERFDPGRFLTDEGSERYSWLPFGGGARRCLGATLAELEIGIALTSILERGEIEPADRELAPIVRRAVTMVPHGGGRVRVA